jgi:hypothetical protein
VSKKLGGLVAGLTVGAVASVGMLPSAHATAHVVTNRFGGTDRYATAAVLAEHAFPTGVQAAFLARGEDFPDGAKGFPDALAANYAAGHYNAPVLLTAGSNVPAATLDALKTLKVKDVVILGGTSAISSVDQAVLNSTQSSSAQGGNIVTFRLAGSDRYQTAAVVAENPGPSAVGTLNGLKTAIIARGDQRCVDPGWHDCGQLGDRERDQVTRDQHRSTGRQQQAGHCGGDRELRHHLSRPLQHDRRPRARRRLPRCAGGGHGG